MAGLVVYEGEEDKYGCSGGWVGGEDERPDS